MMSGAYGGGKKLQRRTWTDKDGIRLFVIHGLKPGEYVLETGDHDVDRMFQLSPEQTAELIKFLQSR
jgi:hypothetical protein